MKENKKIYIIVKILVIVFVFCVVGFTTKQLNIKRTTIDKIELYEGNIENNNPGQGFSINDNNRIWSETQNINIFNSSQIFPGDFGTYEFLISNNTDEDSEYSIEFEEENNFNANVLYKLQRNGEYIAGNTSDWVHYFDLNTSLKTLASKDKDLFKIEWKWVPDNDSEDTSTGRNRNATYLLKATVSATATELYFYTPPAGETEVDVKNEVNVVTGDKIYYYVVIALLSGVVLILVNIIKKQKDKNESI